MKNILILILLTILISCQKESISDIPSYISIENIKLNEDITTNITDAWVYIDENLQGVYELPATFPVLADGKHKLRIKAGIKDNGISSTRITYPFYASFIIEEQEFNPRLTLSITPEVTYLERINLEDNLEDFDGNGLSIETDDAFSTSNINPIDNYYGIITLSDSILLSEISTEKLENIAQEGAPVYLELDYKCNTKFLIGVYVNFPQSGVLQKDLLWVNPKEDWNKIYLNLTATISEAVGAEFFKVFIKTERDFALEKALATIEKNLERMVIKEKISKE